MSLNNQTTIFMTCDQNYDFALANMIIGLKRYNEKLIDKIYIMYDGISDETLEKIQSIWCDKIIFQRYTDEDFNKDIDNNEFIKNHPGIKKYTRFNYAKFYIFDILEKANTNTAVFLDIDMLVVGSLEELISQDVDMLAAYAGRRNGDLGYFKSIGRPELEEKMLYRSGGLYCYNKSIFNKAPRNLTRKCYEIWLSYYAKNKLSSNFDELIFGIVNTFYNFSFKDSRSLGYNCVFGHDNFKNIKPKILHAVAYTKFWSHPASFYLFNEWYGNHKIWIQTYGGEDKVSIPPLPIKNLNTTAELWRFISTFNHTLTCIEYINSKNIPYKLNFNGYNIVINLVNIDIFIYYQEAWSRPFMVIKNKFVSKEINEIALKYNFIIKEQSIEKIYPLHDFVIFINEFKEIITQLQEKNIIKNEASFLLEENKKLNSQIQTLTNEKNSLQNEKSSLQTQISKLQNELNSIPTKKSNLEVLNLEQDLINKKLQVLKIQKELEQDLKNKKLEELKIKKELGEKFIQNITLNLINANSAKARIQNHLAYKLGTIMIANSKSIFGYIKMPYILMAISIAHKEQNKNLKLAKDKLPPLESYTDYQEALKEKECITYKLGEALMRAHKNWYGGGVYQIFTQRCA